MAKTPSQIGTTKKAPAAAKKAAKPSVKKAKAPKGGKSGAFDMNEAADLFLSLGAKKKAVPAATAKKKSAPAPAKKAKPKKKG
jgi:hypothetical protein